jgi:hypothetical protein
MEYLKPIKSEHKTKGLNEGWSSYLGYKTSEEIIKKQRKMSIDFEHI